MLVRICLNYQYRSSNGPINFFTNNVLIIKLINATIPNIINCSLVSMLD
jgi:hypothetical protein